MFHYAKVPEINRNISSQKVLPTEENIHNTGTWKEFTPIPSWYIIWPLQTFFSSSVNGDKIWGLLEG